MSKQSSSGLIRRGGNQRNGIDPIWWAPTLFIVIGGLVALTAASFSGKFQTFVPLTLVSDRAGLVMEDGAKVKLRGVQIGQVASIGTDVKTARLQLKIQPGPFRYLPSNLEAEIKSTTAFGSKFVDLIVPERPSASPLKPGAVLRSRNVTVEVNTVFENLQAVVQALDPAKLNAILSAFAQSVRGKGERIGEAITDANSLLRTVNSRMDTIGEDWRLFGATTAVYSDAAQHILSILDSASTTSNTITDNQRSLDSLLLSAVGFSQTGINVIGANESNIVRAMNLLDPTIALMQKYSPTYTCLFQGAQWYVDHGGRDALGGNGYSVILDAALLFGDDPYRYPKHLPKVNATGGPGGRPSCGSLPDPSANFPVRALVTDTGWGAAPNEIRTNVAAGNPWWANWFPTTKNPPEAPRYFWRGGQPPP
ncbi:MCE family protein [Mycobacterium avium]|jgi:phospholipid/cholesterol/gamma-HCH transport system substrate-binding protein|uniref:MCE family protein n=2 Tax=Mycobacterium avium TaxID=1764 RepID=A0A3B6XB57_MYCAV|nr:MCE family protein [Mycobacterium avium]ETB14170.1 MCE-family protein MCE3A [Mycobacterium avium subsp. silvaticum ATCC 49884]EUA37787.1 mce related family protein [Mycobacterium avium subsp. avium 2285 (R)]TXA43176.1 MCE family protein [Mycobacterium tuberculosis variant bovis]ABK69359.1 virulence factor Mce family protein [Mycobacterium avium 104]ANR93187.1 MCE-family protein MCE3A [Mycobacterium avium]